MEQLRWILLLPLLLRVTKSQTCPNSCSRNGLCLDPGRECQCFEGFTGADCSLRLCPQGIAWVAIAEATDVAHYPTECSNMGLCDRTSGTCSCNSGFSGSACDRMLCPGITNNGPCNGNGVCLSMSNYAQTKDPGTGAVYVYDSIWDADEIYGCVCDPGYYGPDCSQRYCPTGDDPLTGAPINALTGPTQVNTIQMVTCKAGGGTFTLSFQGKTSQNIPFNSLGTDLANYIQGIPTLGPDSVYVRLLGPQACSDSGTSFTVEFLQNFGNIPLLVPSARFLSFSDAINTPNLTVSLIQPGTKENDPCSNRGICDASSGYCTCSENFYTSNGYNQPGNRGDCGYTDAIILYCPGILSCSAHGVCSGDPTYRCSCSDGWTGADCSERTCPTDVSWFTLPSADNQAHLYEQAECSDMGICDPSSGTCACEPGFTGASCNRMSCPGGPSPTSPESESCNGNGKCYDIQTLATFATINGDAAGFTYGMIPNNPSTWDATKVFGCYCDSQHSGYDCSLINCPTGHNPDLVGPQYADEQQLLSCTDTSLTGSVAISFREQTSPAISANSTSAEVEAALSSMNSVGVINVQQFDPTRPDVLCSSNGSQLLVTFLTVHGDLPLMTFIDTGITSFTITEYAKGTKENLPCSNRGLCDYQTGLCTCFAGYGSSDGMGGIGTLGDCGYINPVVLPVLN